MDVINTIEWCTCETPNPIWFNPKGKPMCRACLNVMFEEKLTDKEKETLLNVFLRILKNDHDGYIALRQWPNKNHGSICFDSTWNVTAEEVPLLNRMIRSWAN